VESQDCFGTDDSQEQIDSRIVLIYSRFIRCSYAVLRVSSIEWEFSMLRYLSTCTLALILALLCAGIAPRAGMADESPTPTVSGIRQSERESVRVRPSPRPYDNPHSQPVAGDDVGGGDDVRGGSRKLETLEDSEAPRLDDPVLQWLPEITKASTETGTPISLIAGIMRIESNGDETITSPQRAQGLMQIMPDELQTQGIPQEMWLDPPTNVMAGAVILAQRSGNGWESAAAYYFGIGCDYYGTCTYGYAVAVIGWANAYAELLGDGMWYDIDRIPDVPDSRDPTPTPTDTPEASATPTGTAGATETPGTPGEPTATPSAEPSEEPSAEPTEAPTDEPTAVPTEEPTDVPTEEPTEEPAPTEDTAPADGNTTEGG
jgi:cell division septation protein DedD